MMTFRSALVVPLATLALAGAVAMAHPRVGVGSIAGTVDLTGVSSDVGALVYVQQVSDAFAPAAAKMDQQKMAFVPHILPVVVGTTVTFLNSDPVPHIVLSPDNEKFMLGAERTGESKDHTFAKCVKFPCVYTVLCPIHAEMEGFVVVLQNPFFAVSDKDGRYTIANVPEGKYSVSVWHPKLKGQAEPVTIASSGPTTLDFKLAR